MSTNIIAIDPGATGAIASKIDAIVSLMAMPATDRDICDALEGLIKSSENSVCAVIEDVGTYMPGNSGPSAATFAMHVGALRMALTALKIPFEAVRPQKWQKAFVGQSKRPKMPEGISGNAKKNILAERKRKRKRKIKERAQELFPHISVTLQNADALGILWYYAEERSQRLF